MKYQRNRVLRLPKKTNIQKTPRPQKPEREKGQQKQKAKGLLKLLRLFKPYSGMFAVSVVFSIVSTITSVILPMLTSYMVTYGINAVSTETEQLSILASLGVEAGQDTITFLGTVMLSISFLSIFVHIGNTYFSARASAGYTNIIRRTVFHKVQSLSQSSIDKIGVPSLITRTSNDVSNVHNAILQVLRTALVVPITLFLGLFLAIQLNPSLLKYLAIMIPAFAVFIIVLLILVIPLYSKIQKLTDKINQTVREKIGGIRVIRAFNRMKDQDKKYNDINYELTSMSLRVTRIMAAITPFFLIVMYVAVALLIWDAGTAIEELSVETDYTAITSAVGNLQAFMSYMMIIISSVLSFATVFAVIPRANVSAQRINEVLDMQNDINEPENPVSPDSSMAGTVEFRDVTFRYPQGGEDSLSHISFTAKPGQTTAIIGVTGSGKSSIVNLIPRLYDVTDGAVLVDGVDVRDMSLDELHSKMSIALQKAFVFSGTIRDNLQVGKPDATDDEIWEALRVAQAKNFVSAYPQGLDAIVSQGGTNLSGGQKQRLSIARAVIREAEIYIFDDTFSALDMATDARLRAGIKENLSDACVIIVAQRVGTIMSADQIIVLSNGSMVGCGTHDELVETCEEYRQIVESQLGDTLPYDEDEEEFLKEFYGETDGEVTADE